jgi:glycosyltransferase involved in cell wall biosynthesis
LEKVSFCEAGSNLLCKGWILLKSIAVIPVFNEEKTLLNILNRVSPQVDYVVCVNDGSWDKTFEILKSYARKRKNLFIVNLPFNTGMAGALKNGFLFVLYLAHIARVGPEDVVVTIDADGQHKPEYISVIERYMVRKKADVVLTSRNFSVYPMYKILGNRFLSWTNSILSGIKYKDVESGLRLLKVKTLKPILEYYTGVKYSCAQEIALISARSGFKIDNDFQVDIAYYRAGTTVWDGFIVLFLSFITFWRWRLKLSKNVDFDIPLMCKSFQDSQNLWKFKSASRKRNKNGA